MNTETVVSGNCWPRLYAEGAFNAISGKLKITLRSCALMSNLAIALRLIPLAFFLV